MNADAIGILADALWPHLSKRFRPSQQKFLTVPEVAERLGVTRPHVTGLINDGDLSAINAGRGEEKRALRVSIESVEAFERRRSVA